ncbi:T0035098 isoform 2 [Pan troglodytes]|uniref:T0035098 isoform 2 n=1 Tax=Pan troglodytes TaxID=9598 RepID=A0A2J8NJ92_PANTR|nr:T0035098 isoform 2 [Pan troglodytes]
MKSLFFINYPVSVASNKIDLHLLSRLFFSQESKPILLKLQCALQIKCPADQVPCRSSALQILLQCRIRPSRSELQREPS